MKPVKLNLTKHCIHTEIKRLYNKTVSDYFIKKDADKNELEDKIELFKNALESFDFGELRITCPELAGGGECDVYLEAGPNEQKIIKVNEISITGERYKLKKSGGKSNGVKSRKTIKGCEKRN